MDDNGRKLGWIAIALGALALVVALSGRGGPTWVAYAPQAPAGPPPALAPEAAPVAPRGDFGPRHWEGPRGSVEMHEESRFRHHGPQGSMFGGPRGFDHGWFPFMPFFWIGKLFRLALIALLIVLGLKLLSRRRGPGGPGRGPTPPSQDPEQPPYTGATQNL